VRIVAGRGFASTDRADAEPIAVVNREAVSRYFGNAGDAIGKRITVADGNNAPRTVTIVGISSDTTSPMLVATDAQIYVPIAQWPQRAVTAILQSADPAARLNDARAVMRSLAPRLPVTELRTLDDRQRDEMSSNVVLNGLFIAFAGLALLLAAGGLYGVIAYSVGQRSREIGVRMALGAHPSGIRRMILADGLKITLPGVGVGLLLGLGVAKLAAPILEGVTPTDPATFAGVAVTVVAVALLSILGPAMRAMRLDPARTLRGD
jgi:ABC-type antimicrobial peptide transport system permease subunit